MMAGQQVTCKVAARVRGGRPPTGGRMPRLSAGRPVQPLDVPPLRRPPRRGQVRDLASWPGGQMRSRRGTLVCAGHRGPRPPMPKGSGG